jgi:hypothetical protein
VLVKEHINCSGRKYRNRCRDDDPRKCGKVERRQCRCSEILHTTYYIKEVSSTGTKTCDFSVSSFNGKPEAKNIRIKITY